MPFAWCRAFCLQKIWLSAPAECSKMEIRRSFPYFLFCQRFKKQGSVPFFSFIFRFVKRFQLFICFFEAFSAFSLLSNPQKCFIIIKRSAAISRPVCKNGNPGSSQSVLAARPLCGGLGGFVFFKFYRVIGKRSILLC